MKDYTIYVTEEIAKKAMEKGYYIKREVIPGFGTDVPYFYLEPSKEDKVWNNSWGCFCPTAEQICGWLREEKEIDIEVFTEWADYEPIGYYYEITINKYFKGEGFSPTYIDTLLEGISKALDLI